MTIEQGRLTDRLEQFAWFAPSLPPLTRAIYLTLAYADIFDYPLSVPEIHRRLIGHRTTLTKLKSHLIEGDFNSRILYHQNGMYALAGSEEIINIRKTRSELARKIWPQALNFGHLIARLPFVRMVSVTGALAVDNVDKGTDLDYLVVAEPGHLWTCRAWSIALVKLAALQGVILCPNYFISEHALLFTEQNLYTAHEMIQMVPIFGRPVYEAIRRDNAWSSNFLPNAIGPPATNGFAATEFKRIKSLFERPFRNMFGKRFEQWEMDRKIRKFSQLDRDQTESRFSADLCKGHFDHHGQFALTAFEARLHELEAVL